MKRELEYNCFKNVENYIKKINPYADLETIYLSDQLKSLDLVRDIKLSKDINVFGSISEFEVYNYLYSCFIGSGFIELLIESPASNFKYDSLYKELLIRHIECYDSNIIYIPSIGIEYLLNYINSTRSELYKVLEKDYKLTKINWNK
jgi:hypothetical protein